MGQNLNENIHKDHRKRLTDLVLESSITSVSQIQAVEFFLTYIFPRGDVNPLAHRLLDTFGNFSNIIDADIADLKKIYGINTRAAKKIKLFGQMIDFYTLSKMNRSVNIENTGQFLNLLEDLLRVQSTENLYIFGIDNSFNLIQKRKLDLKNVRDVGINPIDLYSFVLSTNPAYIIVAHNHPNGSATPSDDDHDAVIYIEQLLKHLECSLLDSFIIGVDGIYSEKQDSYVREYKTEKSNIVKL